MLIQRDWTVMCEGKKKKKKKGELWNHKKVTVQEWEMSQLWDRVSLQEWNNKDFCKKTKIIYFL